MPESLRDDPNHHHVKVTWSGGVTGLMNNVIAVTDETTHDEMRDIVADANGIEPETITIIMVSRRVES